MTRKIDRDTLRKTCRKEDRYGTRHRNYESRRLFIRPHLHHSKRNRQRSIDSKHRSLTPTTRRTRKETATKRLEDRPPHQNAPLQQWAVRCRLIRFNERHLTVRCFIAPACCERARTDDELYCYYPTFHRIVLLFSNREGTFRTPFFFRMLRHILLLLEEKKKEGNLYFHKKAASRMEDGLSSFSIAQQVKRCLELFFNVGIVFKRETAHDDRCH